MTSHQPKLLKNSGPVFEFGPGWGTKTRKWIKKYILAADCSLCRNTRYILLAGIIIIIFFGPAIRRMENRIQTKIPETEIIIVDIRSGDSKTKLARRAIIEFLAQSGDLKLSAGQKVFMETRLANLMPDTPLQPGQVIEFIIETIHDLGHQAENLSPSALKKWEKYASKVRF